MSIYIETQRGQFSASEEYNDYCMRHRDLIDDFEAESMQIAEFYEDMTLLKQAMEELENRPKYARHCLEMRRLIEQCKLADRDAITNAPSHDIMVVDPYWSIEIDHTNALNSRYEPTKRTVFDMGRGVRHTVTSQPRRRSTVSITNNPLAK